MGTLPRSRLAPLTADVYSSRYRSKRAFSVALR
jgi:hypothetical protein